MFFFFNISLPFRFQNKENWKCLLASTNVSALCLDFDEVSAILQALHIRALLSRSSGEMKFDSSSCMLKPVYFAFVKTMLEFFFANYTFCQITSTFAKTNEQNNRYDNFETRPFDEGKPCSAVAHAHVKKTPVVSRYRSSNCYQISSKDLALIKVVIFELPC